MFCVVNMATMLPIKSGFMTATQANNWCRKHLPINQVHLYGDDYNGKAFQYFVRLS